MKISCKKCGANIKFVPSIQKACCEHCGSMFVPEELEFDEKIFDEGEKYICSSCGAELLSFDKTGIINCLYCGGKEFVKGNVNKEYILEGIFPFKVDRDEFIQCYEEYFNSINGIDQKFLDRVKQADVKSMYLPYSFANSFYRKQHVREFNKLLEEIIPFNFKELKKMNPIYLDNSLAEIIHTKKEENDIKTKDPTFYWVPVWYAEIEYESIKYYIVMNGQTMEMAGYCNSSNFGKEYEDKIVIEKSVVEEILNKQPKITLRNKIKKMVPIVSSTVSLLTFLLIIFAFFMKAGNSVIASIVVIYILLLIFIIYFKNYYTDLNNTTIKIGKRTFYVLSYDVGKFHITPKNKKRG
ncbi:MAG: hypothetical protein J6C46_10350 [Clostridia bacterium]|nr:hypothetical protein [Clostridia bacterium]